MCRISFRLQHLFSMQVQVIGMHEYKDDLDPAPPNLDREVVYTARKFWGGFCICF